MVYMINIIIFNYFKNYINSMKDKDRTKEERGLAPREEETREKKISKK